MMTRTTSLSASTATSTGWSPGDDPVQGDVCWFGPSNSAQNPGGGVFSGGGRRCVRIFLKFELLFQGLKKGFL